MRTHTTVQIRMPQNHCKEHLLLQQRMSPVAATVNPSCQRELTGGTLTRWCSFSGGVHPWLCIFRSGSMCWAVITMAKFITNVGWFNAFSVAGVKAHIWGTSLVPHNTHLMVFIDVIIRISSDMHDSCNVFRVTGWSCCEVYHGINLNSLANFGVPLQSDTRIWQVYHTHADRRCAFKHQWHGEHFRVSCWLQHERNLCWVLQLACNNLHGVSRDAYSFVHQNSADMIGATHIVGLHGSMYPFSSSHFQNVLFKIRLHLCPLRKSKPSIKLSPMLASTMSMNYFRPPSWNPTCFHNLPGIVESFWAFRSWTTS